MTAKGSGTLGACEIPSELEEIRLKSAAPSVLDSSVIKRLHDKACSCSEMPLSSYITQLPPILLPLPLSPCPKQFSEYFLPDVFLNGSACQQSLGNGPLLLLTSGLSDLPPTAFGFVMGY